MNIQKMDFGEEPNKEPDGKSERMYYSQEEPPELKSVPGKEAPPKPGDVKNGDLVSLLLAATPPYLYNIPLIPQTFFFSEMLKSFVQAKSERQSLKTQQSQKRQRKRSWREMTPPKPVYYESDKPLELTTPRQSTPDDRAKEPRAKKSEDKKSAEFGSSNFTAEKLANSSISSPNRPSDGGGSLELPPPPLWYPPLYPPHPPFGIDPLHFFIDLRVSAHVWDRKLAGDKISGDPALSVSPLNLRSEAKAISDKCPGSPSKTRHKSAFSVPKPRTENRGEDPDRKPNSRSIHYLMSNLKTIFKPRDDSVKSEADEEEVDEGRLDRSAAEEAGKKSEKNCKDLSALIGLELVVDYVKQESDGSDEDEANAGVDAERIPQKANSLA